MNLSRGRLAEFIHRRGSRCGFLQRVPVTGCFTDSAGCFREQIASRVCLPCFLATDSRRVEAELCQVCFWKFSGTKFGPLKALSRTFFPSFSR